MIGGLQVFAGWIAAAATINSVVSWSAEMPGDCKFWSVLAVVALAVALALRYVGASLRRRREAEPRQWYPQLEAALRGRPRVEATKARP